MAKPIRLSDVNTETLEESTWLAWREHGPEGNIKWTIGGSDVATILNISPWNSVLELYEKKKGIRPAINVNYNASAKKTGHLNEAHIARLFENDLKEMFPERQIELGFDKCMYQCGDRNPDGTLKYPWMIVNYDAYVFIDGELYLVEIKTTSPRNFDIIEKWKQGICPEYYECQCRYYMKVLDVKGIFIVCAWDFQPLGEGRNFVFIERDEEAENYIIDECENFIQCLETDIPPDLWSTNTTLLRNYYDRKYGPNEGNKEEFEIPQDYLEHIKEYLSLEEEIQKKKERIKVLEKLQDACLVQLYPLFADKQKGRILIDETTDVYVTSKQSYKKETPCREEYFKGAYPDVYAKYLKTSIDMTRLKKEQPQIYKEVALPKEPTDKRNWTLKKYERKVV